MAVTNTTILATDRLAIKVIYTGTTTNQITFFTQGSNVSKATSSIALGTPMGASTSCSFEASTEQVEVTSQSSAWFKEFKNDVQTWTVSCDGFVAVTGYSYLALMQKQLNRESVAIRFSINNDNADGSATYGYSIISGTTNITSLSLSAPVEGVSTYSLSLQGTGGYSISGTQVIDGGTSVSTSGISSATFIAAGGEYTITFVNGIGKTLVSLTRGGIEVRTINSSGTPTGEDVTFNSLTGVLIFARALESDEFVRATFS
jgi:predicted secreted protein